MRNNRPVKALLFPIDFPDLVGTSSPESDFARITKGITDYYSAMSDGRVVIDWVIFPSYTRYHLPVSETNMGGRTSNGYHEFSRQAIRLARSTLDMSSFQFVIFAPPPSTKRSQIAIGPAFVSNSADDINATMLDGQAYDQKNPEFNMVHEVAHLMGVADLYNYNAANESAAGTASAFERQFVYMGVFDIMSYANGPAMALTAWNRWLTDLVSDSQIRCLPRSRTVTHLAPLETAGGIKGVVIPLSRTQAIVMESRRAIRYDAELKSESEGVLVYKVDTSVYSGYGPMRVIPRPGSSDIWHRDAPLKLGETRVVEGYSIKVVETGVFGDVVEVSSN